MPHEPMTENPVIDPCSCNEPASCPASRGLMRDGRGAWRHPTLNEIRADALWRVLEGAVADLAEAIAVLARRLNAD